LGIVSFFVLKSRTSTSPAESNPQSQTPSTLPTESNQPLSTAAPIQKSFPANEYNLQKQALDSYDTLNNDPNLVASIQSAQNDFRLADMGTSFPSAIAKLKNGNEVVIFSGCEPHNCGGTEKIVAYEKKTKKSYVFIEKYNTDAGYEILGNPSEEIGNLLIFYYTNK
jgi:hypothetical protein